MCVCVRERGGGVRGREVLNILEGGREREVLFMLCGSIKNFMENNHCLIIKTITSWYCSMHSMSRDMTYHICSHPCVVCSALMYM